MIRVPAEVGNSSRAETSFCNCTHCFGRARIKAARMAYILVVNPGYAGPCEIGGQTYTVVTGSPALVAAGDKVLIDDANPAL